MSDEPSRDMHRDAGAYLMGALDAADRETFEAHLVSCDRCKAELIELAPVPGLLARVDIEEFDHPFEFDATPIIEAARAQVKSLERSRRRWQITATGLATAAAVLAVALVFGSGESDPGPQFDPGNPVELVLASNTTIEGRVAVTERPWGARVEIDLEGLPADQGYEIWAVDGEGNWELAASFEPRENGTCRVVGATSVHPVDLDQIVVTTRNRAAELVWASEE